MGKGAEMGVWGVMHAVLALAFVLGLLFLTLWFIKYLQLKTPKSRLFQKLQAEQRIEVIETKRLDTKNTLILIRKDDKEFMFVTGTAGNLLLEAGTIVKKAKKHD